LAVRRIAVRYSSACLNVGGQAAIPGLDAWITKVSLTTLGVEPRCSHCQARIYSLFTCVDVKGLRCIENLNGVV
jgi:hypothetical protein